MGRLPIEITDYIKSKAKKRNFEIVNIGARTGGTFAVEIVLDNDNGITLDECASFNRDIVSWIEEKGIIQDKFVLDVCSPGLDRELKSDEEFNWAKGKRVNVIATNEEGKQEDNIGKLLDKNDDGDISIESEDGSVLSIERKKIIRTRRQEKYVL